MSECCVCNGDEYKGIGYGQKLCENHDVCVNCGIKRKDLKETPWGSRFGAFLCKPCEVKERNIRIAVRQEQGFEHDFTDNITCPHCGFEYTDSWEFNKDDGDILDCPECCEKFELTVYVSVSYGTEKEQNNA